MDKKEIATYVRVLSISVSQLRAELSVGAGDYGIRVNSIARDVRWLYEKGFIDDALREAYEILGAAERLSPLYTECRREDAEKLLASVADTLDKGLVAYEAECRKDGET